MRITRVFALLLLLTPLAALAYEVCEVTTPMAAFSIPYVAKAPELNTDPHSATWSHAASTWIEKDCSQKLDYRSSRRKSKAFWTDDDLHLRAAKDSDPRRRNKAGDGDRRPSRML